MAPEQQNAQECCQNIHLSLGKESHTDKMLSCGFHVALKVFCVPRVHSRPIWPSEALFNNSLFLLRNISSKISNRNLLIREISFWKKAYLDIFCC